MKHLTISKHCKKRNARNCNSVEIRGFGDHRAVRLHHRPINTTIKNTASPVRKRYQFTDMDIRMVLFIHTDSLCCRYDLLY